MVLWHEMPWAVIVPILGVVFAPLLTYLVAARRSSGKVKTTEAETLWQELRAELIAYRAEVGGLRTEIGSLHAVISSLEAEVRRLNAIRPTPRPRPRKAE